MTFLRGVVGGEPEGECDECLFWVCQTATGRTAATGMGESGENISLEDVGALGSM